MAQLTTVNDIVFRHRYEDAGFVSGMQQAAEAAGASAAAGERLVVTSQRIGAETARAAPAWASANRAVEENARLAAATERANRTLEQQLIALRREAETNPETAARQVEAEQRLIAVRDAAVKKAQEQAAAERARWEAAATSSAGAGRGLVTLTTQAGEAGKGMAEVALKTQQSAISFEALAQKGSAFLGKSGGDVVNVTAKMLTAVTQFTALTEASARFSSEASGGAQQVDGMNSAFVGLLSTFAQLAVVFGTRGVIPGASLGLGAFATKIFGVIDASDQLSEVTQKQAAQYSQLTEAAKRRVEGMAAEAQALANLTTEYTAMGEAARKAEAVRLRIEGESLQAQQDKLRAQLGGNLGTLEPIRGSNFALADIYSGGDGTQRLAPDLDAGAEAFKRLREAGDLTTASVRAYIVALDDAVKSGGANADMLTSQRDKALELLPKIADLEKAQRLNAVQAAALLLASGQTAEGLIALGASAGGAAGKFQMLSPAIVYAGVALRQLRKDIADDPLKSINAEASRIADLAAALRSGGIPAYERFKDAQTAAAKAQETLNQKTKEFIAARSPEVGAAQAEKEAADKRVEWEQQILAVQRAEQGLNKQLELTRKAEADAAAAAKARGSELDTAAKKAAEAQAEFERTHYSEPRLTDNGRLLSFGEADEKAMAVARRTAAEFQAEQKTMADTARAAADENRKAEQAAAKQSTDSIVRYAGDAFADLFRDNTRSWSDMWRGFLGTARATLARIAAEALLRPIIQPIVMSVIGSVGSGVTSAASGSTGSSGLGLSDASSLLSGANTLSGGSMFSGIGQSLGITGSGGILNSLTSTGSGLSMYGGLFGTANSVAAPSIAGMTSSEALASLPGISTSTTGAAGMSAFGGIAGGVGLGMLGGSIVGGMRGSVDGTRNSAIGSIAGTAIGFAVGGPVGALVGGAIGGSAGGLFGPTKKGMAQRSGGDVAYANVDGQLQIIGGGGKRWDSAAAFAEVQQQLDQLNAAISQRGLTLSGPAQGMVGFGQASKNPTSVSTDIAGMLTSTDANVQTAINNRGGKTLEQVFGDIDWVQQVYNPLTKVGEATSAFQQQLDALSAQYAPVIERAGSLGLATDKLSEDLAKGIATLGEARNAAVNQATDSISFRLARATSGANNNNAALEFDVSATAERTAWKAQLEAWGLDAEQVAFRINLLEQTQGAERVQIVRKANEAAAAQLLSVWTSGATLFGRLQAAMGDSLGAALTAFDVSAAQQRVQLRTSLADAFATDEEIARQAAMLETVLGAERLKIIEDANARILQAERERAAAWMGIWSSSNSLLARRFRADGDSLTADLVDFDVKGGNERTTLIRTLTDWGASAEEVTKQVAWLDEVLGKERLKIAEDYNKQLIAAERERWAKSLSVAAQGNSLYARQLRLKGDDLGADLADFDVAAWNERAQLSNNLQDWGASGPETMRQIMLLETVLGGERLKIIADANKKIVDAEKAAADQRMSKASSVVDSLTAYTRSLRTRQDSPLSVQEQYMGASSDFNASLAKAQAGDGDAIASLTARADAFLAASRNVYGSGAGFAADFSRVLQAIGTIAEKTPEQLTAAVYATEMRTQTQILNDSLTALRAEVAGLRTEVRLNGTRPVAA